jgi:hypothetical protein
MANPITPSVLPPIFFTASLTSFLTKILSKVALVSAQINAAPADLSFHPKREMQINIYFFSLPISRH